MSNSLLKKRTKVILFFALTLILGLAELTLLAFSLGFLYPRPYVSSAIVALHRFQVSPTPETELAWCKERERLTEKERNFDRLATVILVLNTGILLVSWRRFRRATASG